MTELLEVWKEVPNTRGVYFASSIGRVKRTAHVSDAGRNLKEKILVPTSTGDGHLQVGVFGRLKTVHSLVLLAFVGDRPDGMIHTRHLDDDPSNNVLANLRYGTPKENAADRQTNSPLAPGVRTKERAMHVRARLAERVDWTYGDLSRLGQEYGLCFAQVRRIHNGKAWAHV